jgi:leucyl aminopeptidase
VLVGKGITFDSGGISIKPSLNMGEMKSDMSGAAAVVATMRAVADLNVPRPVVGVTPLAENMPSATAYRPGDIVRALGKKSIEIVNTDAEGRLVLADALAYACERYEPACVVDLATLTGACVVALGSAAAGLMSTDDALCEQLLVAGDASGDRLWRLPLWETYDKLIESDVADIKNSGGRDAGAITAAKLLQQFVGETPWAHLDIAGTAFTKEASPYQPKGGTGYGVRLLTQWLTT